MRQLRHDRSSAHSHLSQALQDASSCLLIILDDDDDDDDDSNTTKYLTPTHGKAC